MVTFILLIIGGLNWLLVGLLGYDVSYYFGGMESTLAKIIYILVGLSAIIEVVGHKKICSQCMTKGEMR
ncbi:MAG: DUF378 domain-containing protein [Anaplasmataceae bacterium]|nr:DUF378 domain-containing protein [Anaplasmataceae bacterium]